MDIRTLLIVMLTSGLVLTLSLIASNFAKVPVRGRTPWVLTIVFQSLGFGLLATQEVLPAIVSIVVANALVAAGQWTNLIGFRVFFGLPGVRAWHSAAYALVVLLFLIWTLVAPSTQLRILLISGYIVACTGGIIWQLAKRGGAVHAPIRIVALTVFGLSALLHLGRIVVTLLNPPASLLSPSLSTGLVFLGSDVLIVGQVLSFILLQLSQMVRKWQDSIAQLRASNAAKDKLLAMISHDLRGPISNIRLINSTLASSVDESGCVEPELQIESRRIIEGSVNSALSILENLMNWARVQKGELGANRSRQNLAELCKLAVSQVRAQAQAKEITLAVQVDPGLETNADPDALVMILRNVLNNAIKFTPRQGTVSLKGLMDKAPVLVIQDSGIGMDQGQLSRLFEAGSSRVRSGTAGERGTGLGLVLSAELAARSDARLRYESQPNQGTTVYLELAPAANPAG